MATRRRRQPPPARPHLRVGLAAMLVVGIGLLGWALLKDRGQPAGLRERGANVLLITIDTLRTDAVGAYGNAQASTPWMDRLAASGLRFEQARAHNVVTLPSHANILSGLYPIHHGVRDNAGFRFPADRETLATILKQNGYATAAFVSAYPLASRFGLSRGFDVYDDEFLDALPGQPFLVQERRGTETIEHAQRWIASARSPWFAWVHLYEPHYPYAPPEPFASRFRGNDYAGEVAATDAALAPLVEPILVGKGLPGTVVVLTSDHGESLGEHGEATHGILAYESTVDVPLVVHMRQLGKGRSSAQPARHVDVLPTILDAVMIGVPAGLDGTSLLPQVEGRERSGVTTYFEALSGTLNRGWAPLHGVVRGDLKYVDLPIPELYDLAADRGETRNLADTQPARVREMRALLAEERSREVGVARRAESPQARERLRSLGYVAGVAESSRPYTEADDPKRLIKLDAILREVVGLYERRDLDGAARRCRDLIRERPAMAISLLYLAQIERERGNLSAAIDALQTAFELNPGDATTASVLSAYLTQAGRADDALRVLEAYDARDEPDEQVSVARALALARLGRFNEALDVLERAARADPSNAGLSIEAGTVQLMAGNQTMAQRAFERAIQLNPNAARAHNSLGAMAAESGRGEEARRHWQRAVELDQREYAMLFAIGVAHVRAGRPEVARPFLEFFAASAPQGQYAADIARARQWLGQSSR
jgi:arylsulfatase A-like enzyme/Flp pilus assembly protein TadD